MNIDFWETVLQGKTDKELVEWLFEESLRKRLCCRLNDYLILTKYQ